MSGHLRYCMETIFLHLDWYVCRYYRWVLKFCLNTSCKCQDLIVVQYFIIHLSKQSGIGSFWYWLSIQPYSRRMLLPFSWMKKDILKTKNQRRSKQQTHSGICRCNTSCLLPLLSNKFVILDELSFNIFMASNCSTADERVKCLIQKWKKKSRVAAGCSG